MKKVVFLSITGDFHASVVGQTLLQRFGSGLELSIIDMDERSVRGGFSWDISSLDGSGSVLIKGNLGEWIALDETDVIWCRRFTRNQRKDDSGFLTKQWNSASWSLVNFSNTKWIDRPRDIVDAENKPVQLKHAHEAGFSIPNTLVSQDKNRIKAFFYANGGQIIVKPLKASIKKQIFTVSLPEKSFEQLDQFSLFPAIYQQKILGDIHLRIVCLPNAIITFMIESNELDWRKNRDVKIQKVDTDPKIAAKCKLLLEKLNLTMGIIDAKKMDDKIYFLEINPQGQFLFLEAMSGFNLRNIYADYFLGAL